VAAIKTFEHDDGPITVRDGRYGPYVNQGKVNATLPKDLKPEDVTLEQALALIAAKGGAGGKTRKTAAKKTAKPKAAAAKATKAKPAAKAKTTKAKADTA
jgi:DNA topoisomerase-1